MVNPVHPVAFSPPADNATAESRRQPADGGQFSLPAPVPSEVVTLSDLALQGAQPTALRERRRAAAQVPKTAGDATAAATRLRDLLVAVGPQAAHAQAHGSPERVWRLVRE